MITLILMESTLHWENTVHIRRKNNYRKELIFLKTSHKVKENKPFS